MKDFDMKRFGQVLKLDFAEGKKTMMWGALAMTLLYLFFFWFAHSVGYKDVSFEPRLPGIYWEPDLAAAAATMCQALCNSGNIMVKTVRSLPSRSLQFNRYLTVDVQF